MPTNDSTQSTPLAPHQVAAAAAADAHDERINREREERAAGKWRAGARNDPYIRRRSWKRVTELRQDIDRPAAARARDALLKIGILPKTDPAASHDLVVYVARCRGILRTLADELPARDAVALAELARLWETYKEGGELR